MPTYPIGASFQPFQQTVSRKSSVASFRSGSAGGSPRASFSSQRPLLAGHQSSIRPGPSHTATTSITAPQGTTVARPSASSASPAVQLVQGPLKTALDANLFQIEKEPGRHLHKRVRVKHRGVTFCIKDWKGNRLSNDGDYVPKKIWDAIVQQGLAWTVWPDLRAIWMPTPRETSDWVNEVGLR